MLDAAEFTFVLQPATPGVAPFAGDWGASGGSTIPGDAVLYPSELSQELVTPAGGWAVAYGAGAILAQAGDYQLEAWSVIVFGTIDYIEPTELLATDNFGNPFTAASLIEGVRLEQTAGPTTTELASEGRRIPLPLPAPPSPPGPAPLSPPYGPPAHALAYPGGFAAKSRVTTVRSFAANDVVRVGHHLNFGGMIWAVHVEVVEVLYGLRITRLPFPAATPSAGAVQPGDQRSGVRAGPRTIAGRTTAAPDAASSGGPGWGGSGV